MDIAIRSPAPADEAAWRRLWARYVAFYESTVPETVTAGAWSRALDPVEPLIMRLAIADSAVVGFSLTVLHAGTWSLSPYGYLEDLFVDSALRGHGAGRALIEDLIALGKARGWARLYWHTRQDNPARALYDAFAAADDFVRYRLPL